MDAELPDGWTIERVRSASGDATADPLPLERLVVIEEHEDGRTDYAVLQPDVIISFHGLCLARVDGDWFMGHLEADGSIVCRACYGPDLGEAIEGL
ncbi:hypothetical protein AB0C52_19825 [Streptomyces sp. NPDC048717]|uniref:hypothetical protein n=1 Tax=Streptomyces sp. NPDC048717 TaxID=3154928 RepID=UPI003435570E